jgi:hypothetical protein
MSDTNDILSSGKSMRDESRPTPSEADVLDLEVALLASLPESFKQFYSLGGLKELRINHSVLTPDEIIAAKQWIASSEFYPFADNHCGDYYCFRVGQGTVYFCDHETGAMSQDSESFVEWLRKNKF